MIPCTNWSHEGYPMPDDEPCSECNGTGYVYAAKVRVHLVWKNGAESNTIWPADDAASFFASLQEDRGVYALLATGTVGAR